MAAEKPALVVADAQAWRAWLDANEAESQGVWLILAKKGVTEPTSLTYSQALDEALCSGWIDGQVNKIDDRVYKQSFTPRRRGSSWSARNVGFVARLTEEGRMRPRGLQEVEHAKADGRWERAYEGRAKFPVPEELQAALDRNPKAAATFDSLNGQSRFAILYRLHALKTEVAKTRNIEKFIAKLENGETAF